MSVFGAFLALLSVIGILVFLILGVVALIKNNGKAKRQFQLAGGSFIVTIISFIIIGVSPDDSTKTSTEPSKEEKLSPEQEAAKNAEKEAKMKAEAAAKEKAKAEAKAKAAAEAKAKAEQEARVAAQKKANAKSIDYPHLKKNPDRYKGQYVKYTGQIIQIMEDGNKTNIRLSVTKDELGYSNEDIIFVEYDGATDYVEGDVVSIYGEISGTYSYTSQAGWEISIPGLIADSVEK